VLIPRCAIHRGPAALSRLPAILALSTALFLAACGGGGSGVGKTPTPTPTPTAGYVPLTETAFIGDEIVSGWSEMNTGGSSFGVFGIANGTTEQITQYLGTEDQCISGCTPKLFQYLASNGMKRAVLLIGTYDVLGSLPCEGGPAAAWDGKAGDAGDPTVFYYPMIQAAKQFYSKVSLVVGTIPPLGAPYNTAGCVAVVNTLNGELKTMATANNVPLADFNAALSASDITATGAYEGIVPTASGYTIMSQVYGNVNQ